MVKAYNLREKIVGAPKGVLTFSIDKRRFLILDKKEEYVSASHVSTTPALSRPMDCKMSEEEFNTYFNIISSGRGPDNLHILSVELVIKKYF